MSISIIKTATFIPRYIKRIIAIILDFGLCILCTWLAFYLRLEKFITIRNAFSINQNIQVLATKVRSPGASY